MAGPSSAGAYSAPRGCHRVEPIPYAASAGARLATSPAVLAARIHDFGSDPVVQDVPQPAPAAGESLVALEAAAVGHIDLTVATGTFAYRPPLPYVPGTDGAGRVLASERFAAGTPVRVRGAGVGRTRDGTWAERAAVPDEALDELPAGVDPALAATFFSPCLTADLAVREIGGLQPGEQVAIVGGAGAVGAVAVQLALRGGAAEVVAVVREERAAAVPAGARAATSITGEAPLDLVVDTAGGPGLQERIAAVRPEGRLVLVGYAAGTESTLDLPAFLAADVRLLPVNLIRWEARLRPRAAELLAELAAGALELPVVSFALADVGKALAALRSRSVQGRIVLLPRRAAGAAPSREEQAWVSR